MYNACYTTYPNGPNLPDGGQPQAGPAGPVGAAERT